MQCFSILKPGQVICDDILGAGNEVDFGGDGHANSEVDGAD